MGLVDMKWIMIQRSSKMMMMSAGCYMEGWLGDLGYDVYQLISDSIYARRSVLNEWLREKGFDPDKTLSFEGDNLI